MSSHTAVADVRPPTSTDPSIMTIDAIQSNSVHSANGTSTLKAKIANGVAANGSSSSGIDIEQRMTYPQVTFAETRIEPSSFYGKLRTLYANQVLKTQLDQLRKQGSYDAFKLQWHPSYDVRPLERAKFRHDGIPPSLFWESDVGKWIEAACYFLQSDPNCEHAAEFRASIDELVTMIEGAQQPDGYLNIYFAVVDPEGRYQNLRDMHEMYNAGHLLEGALAHYQYTGERRFLDVMIKNIDCFMKTFGPDEGQQKGYPGHPELELAVLRLYAVTKDPRHLAFGKYLLHERGQLRPSADGKTKEPYFVTEAKKRYGAEPHTRYEGNFDISYHQAHKPIVEQEDIFGHSVRAFYLLTGAVDAGGELLPASRRLWADAVQKKMYVTGGFGSVPGIEGFSKFAHDLPQSSAEGGCYAETCASIAAMMCAERLLSHELDGGVRDVMELALLNAVLGGGSLDGKAFAYANKLATCKDESAERKEWFEVCCCPPNLSRTMGMLGGYTWRAQVDSGKKRVALDVYLFVSGTRNIDLGNGAVATATMKTGMPWKGETTLELSAPEGWEWDVRVPSPSYAADIKLSVPSQEDAGFLAATLPSTASASLTFSLPVRLLASHPAQGDTITVSRGPIIYVAESVDNAAVDERSPHFEGLGISPSAEFDEAEIAVEGVPVISLTAGKGHVLKVDEFSAQLPYRKVSGKVRTWTPLEERVTFVPWFARANRGGACRVRTSFMRAE